MPFFLTLACDFSCKQADVCEEEPCGSTGDCCLDILGESAASTEPGEGSLDNPSAGQKFEAFCVVGALYDLDNPFPDFFEASFQLGPGIVHTYSHAHEIIEVWRNDQNLRRPHTSFDGLIKRIYNPLQKNGPEQEQSEPIDPGKRRSRSTFFENC